MKRIFGLFMALAMIIGLSVPAHATLILRGTDTLGNRLIYDDDLNITWYDYTKSYDTWQNQVNWADTLSVTFGSTVYNDWRLPIVTDTGTAGCNWGYSGTDCGYNVNTLTGEMAHLFYYELGNLAYYNTAGSGPQAGWGLYDTGDFQKLQASVYWSGTEYSANPDVAWFFYFDDGVQDANNKAITLYAMAVRPGDVSTSVPEPATMFLLGSGLAGMAVLRKRLGRRED